MWRLANLCPLFFFSVVFILYELLRKQCAEEVLIFLWTIRLLKKKKGMQISVFVVFSNFNNFW